MQQATYSEDLQQADVLCVYGEDIEELYQEYSPWLLENPEHFLIFLHPPSDHLTRFILSEKGREFYKHRHVRIFAIEKDHEEEIFKQIAWEFVFLRCHYVINSDAQQALFDKLAFYQSAIHLIASDYSDLGIGVFKNFLANAQLLSRSKHGAALYNEFKNTPAIICGAGPSLNQDLELLKKVSDRALIFGGGSSLQLLSQAGITPHFGAVIDSCAPVKRFLHQSNFEMPLFFQNRVSSELLSHAHGPLLWMRSNGNYPIEDWLMSYLEISTPVFDAGWNVVTFSCALAKAFGCDPIILVGADLACDEQSIYSPGIDAKPDAQEFFSIKNRQGQRVLTKRDFLMASHWLEAFANKHDNRRFINCSSQGIDIEGFVNRSFKEVVENELTLQRDLYNEVSAKVAVASDSFCDNYLLQRGVAQIAASLKRCDSFCLQLIKRLEKTYPELPKKDGEFLFLEVQLEEELVFEKIIQPLWGIWHYVLERQDINDPQWEFGRYINRLLFYKKIIDQYKSILKLLEN